VFKMRYKDKEKEGARQALDGPGCLFYKSQKWWPSAGGWERQWRGAIGGLPRG